MTFGEVEKILADSKTRSLMGAPELEALFSHVINGVDNPLVVELGSYCGASSLILRYAVGQKGGKLICVDAFKPDFDAQYFTGEDARQAWHKLMDGFGDVELYDMETSKGAIKFNSEKNKEIDVLFVDADHSYAGVSQDIDLWVPFVKEHGTIIFHDYYNPAFSGIKEAVELKLKGYPKVAEVWSMAIFQKESAR